MFRSRGLTTIITTAMTVHRRRSFLCTAAKRHFERRLMNYSCEELFSVVSNVAEYDQFVPWCKKSHVIYTDRTGNLEAELCIGFGILNEKYSSHVVIVKPTTVIATSNQSNVFEYLKTEWKFTPSNNDPSKTWVTFQLDFKFRSELYSSICEMFMQDVVNKMVRAFEDRCFTVCSNRKHNKTTTLT
jgi:ribosome-associated toxin RatA of RatAB toxin-antitoxin module